MGQTILTFDSHNLELLQGFIDVQSEWHFPMIQLIVLKLVNNRHSSGRISWR